MEALRSRLLEGMAKNGVTGEVADQIYDKLKAFADFGFPESHAYSFAYLVYASAWVKVYHPAIFYAALLAAQPMGFYSPQTLVADARRRGITTLRPCVDRSEVEATVERNIADGVLQIRMGLTAVRGVGEAAERIVAARKNGAFRDTADLVRRVGLSAAQLEALATAGALESFGLDRRAALWQSGAVAGGRVGRDDREGV